LAPVPITLARVHIDAAFQRLDEWGFVVTGPSEDNLSRLQFESAVPGVFAVGDVRRDSMKRVASVAGEGAVCVRLVYQYLADQ
jgi:thioredoxin reductase (NADPH)